MQQEKILNERFKEVRKHFKYTQIEMADKLEITQGSVTDVERGKVSVTNKLAQKMFSKLHINPDWFYTGKGSIENTDKLVILNTDIPTPENEYVEEWSKEIKSNPNYRVANSMYFKMLSEQSEALAGMIKVFNAYWKNTRSLIQFIDQYDFIIQHPAPQLAILSMFNRGTQNDVEKKFKAIFENLPEVLSIMGKLNDMTLQTIDQLRPMDFNNELSKDYFLEAEKIRSEAYEYLERNNNEAFREKYDEALSLEIVYDKLTKEYPNLDI
jgi:transcriptional regulator with XRE-family HTH domain